MRYTFSFETWTIFLPMPCTITLEALALRLLQDTLRTLILANSILLNLLLLLLKKRYLDVPGFRFAGRMNCR